MKISDVFNQWFSTFSHLLKEGEMVKIMDLLRPVSVCRIRDMQQKNLLHYVSAELPPNEILAFYLIRAGCDVNSMDSLESTPLEYAVKTRNIKIAKVLLEAGAVRDNSYYHLDNGPLHQAAISGDVEMLKLFLEHGFDAKAIDESGQTVWHHVAQNKYSQFEAFENLIKTGLDVNFMIDESSLLHYVVKDYYVYLSSTEKLKISKLLIAAGININCLDIYGRTALHYACKNMHEDEQILRLLLENGASTDIRDVRNRDPLSYGLQKLWFPAAALYIRESYDSDTETLPRYNNLIKTLISRMKLMFEYGAKVNLANEKVNPLFSAVLCYRNSELLQFLLNMGVAYDFEDEMTSRVLTKGHNGSKEISTLLISHAAISLEKSRADMSRNFDPINLSSCQQLYYAQCTEELQVMKTTIIEHTDVSFLDILADKVIKCHLLNEHVIKAMNDDQLLNRFPIYRDRLVERFNTEKEDYELKLNAMKSLGYIFKINVDAYRLIFNCITDYLTESDLRTLSHI
ncbi:tankyrase-2-like [Copidosoma floridanum]|uniref:tankyrase-2-like n=1 Tax=Copidosoma floridanum TaxID=29053 RepID=UPI0006C95C5C|nr:tankyrase-2-like [Copidosoma floridanum]